MKKSITCLAAASLLGLAAPAAMANSDDTSASRFYIAPMLSYDMPDNGTPISGEHDGQLGGQLSIGKNFGDYFALELYGFYFDDMGPSDTQNTDIAGYGASALFFPARDLLPVYAVVGAGIGQYDFDGGSKLNQQDSEFYDVGIGYMYQLNDYGVKLRAEYRYRSANVEMPSSTHKDVRNNIISVGIQVPLSAPAQEPAPEPAPAPTPAPEPTQPADSDHDGVIDRIDECPATPRGTEVNASGCPIVKKAPVVLRGVTFEFDSAKLTEQAQNRLDNVIAALNASPDVKFSIAGYTDSIGSEAYNQKLSERRAQSVKEYLVEHGISPSRITRVVGYGESNPVATNETEAGRAQNRRVELNVTQQ